MVQEEYARLLTAEVDQHLAPAESAALLAERVTKLGFRNYDALMAHTLTDELMARNRILERDEDRLLACFGTLMEGAQSIISTAA